MNTRALFFATVLCLASSGAMAEVQDYYGTAIFNFASSPVGEKLTFSDKVNAENFPSDDPNPLSKGYFSHSLGISGLLQTQSYLMRISVVSTAPFLLDLLPGDQGLPNPLQPKDKDGFYRETRDININGRLSPYFTTTQENSRGQLYDDFDLLTRVADEAAYTVNVEYLASNPVPEPASVALMFAGLGVVGLLMRRRREV